MFLKSNSAKAAKNREKGGILGLGKVWMQKLQAIRGLEVDKNAISTKSPHTVSNSVHDLLASLPMFAANWQTRWL